MACLIILMSASYFSLIARESSDNKICAQSWSLQKRVCEETRLGGLAAAWGGEMM